MRDMMRDVSRVIRVKVRDLPEPEMRGPNEGVWPVLVGRLVAVRDSKTGYLNFLNEFDPEPEHSVYRVEGDPVLEPVSSIPPSEFRTVLLTVMAGQRWFHEVFAYRWKQITAELKRENRERSPVLTRFCGKKKIRACTAGVFRMVSQVLGLKLAWVEKQRVGYTFSGGVYDRDTDSCCGHLDIRINGVDVLRYDFWDVKGVVEEKFVPYRYNVFKLKEEHDRWLAEEKERLRMESLTREVMANQVAYLEKQAGDPPNSVPFHEQMGQMMRRAFPEYIDPQIKVQTFNGAEEGTVEICAEYRVPYGCDMPISEQLAGMVCEAAAVVLTVYRPGWEAKVEAALRKAIGETRGQVRIKIGPGKVDGSCDVEFEFEDSFDLQRVLSDDFSPISIQYIVSSDELKG